MIILGTNSIKASGFDVDYSCRFDNPNTPNSDTATDYLTRTFSAGNRRTFTISYWVKRGNLNPANSFQQVIGQQASDYFRVGFGSNEQGNIFRMYGRGNFEFRTKRFARDVAAWYHVCLSIDTTQGTESNRAKLYINGVQETEFYTANYPSQNTELDYNRGARHTIGKTGGTNGIDAFPGYLAQIVSIDGSALAPTDFGEFDADSGIWKPIDVSGLTFGSQGFFLDFADAADLGDDESGNGNDWTETGIAAINQVTDTPTNNFATLNPLIFESSANTFAEGNLKITGSGADSWTTHYGLSTIAVSTGKWFVEVKVTNAVTSQAILGLISTSQALSGSLKDFGTVCVEREGRITGGGNNIQTGLTAFATNDIAGIAFDATNGTVQFYRNGSAYGNAISSIASDTYYFATTHYDAAGSVEFNFGNPPYAISSGNADGDGYGNFEYAVPSSYYSLNTKNLAEYG